MLSNLDRRAQIDENSIRKSANDAFLTTAGETLEKARITRHSKPFSTPELKRPKSVYNTAQKRYKARSDPNNWKSLQKAISEYKDMYNREEQRWLEKDKASSDLDSTDPKFWKKLHELTKGRQAYTGIQPLKDGNGEYRFDDADIARMLEECHVIKTNADTSNFDQNWFYQVSDAVPGNIQEEIFNLTGSLTLQW